MSQDIKNTIIEVIETLKSDPAISQTIGDFLYHIIKKAIDDALVYEIRMIDGKSEPGRQIEKTVRINILAHLAEYLPSLEGRMLGQQADIGHARNAADNACKIGKANYQISAMCADALNHHFQQIKAAEAVTVKEISNADTD